jgi:hypothetical protein
MTELNGIRQGSISNESDPVYDFLPRNEQAPVAVAGDDYFGLTIIENYLYNQQERNTNIAVDAQEGLHVNVRQVYNRMYGLPDREQQNASSMGSDNSAERHHYSDISYADGNLTVIDNSAYTSPDQQPSDFDRKQLMTAVRPDQRVKSVYPPGTSGAA